MNSVETIENYPDFIVKKGDIVVFRNLGEDGHVAICTGEADLNGFRCIEQNWSNTRQLEEIWHDYLYGNPVFLRPKDQSNIVEKVLKNIDKIAQEVIEKKWGDGAERYERLTKAGYNYTVVQEKVNEILKKERSYTVVAGDNLTNIANRFGVTVDHLVQKNNIANINLIYPGQVLKI